MALLTANHTEIDLFGTISLPGNLTNLGSRLSEMNNTATIEDSPPAPGSAADPGERARVQVEDGHSIKISGRK